VLEQEGNTLGPLLCELKSDINQPSAAMLSLILSVLVGAGRCWSMPERKWYLVVTAHALKLLIWMLYPIVMLAESLTRRISPDMNVKGFNRKAFAAMVELGE
jgi:hypothetical protein